MAKNKDHENYQTQMKIMPNVLLQTKNGPIAILCGRNTSWEMTECMDYVSIQGEVSKIGSKGLNKKQGEVTLIYGSTKLKNSWYKVITPIYLTDYCSFGTNLTYCMIQNGLKGVIFPTLPEIPVLRVYQFSRRMPQIHTVFSDKMIFEQIPNTILKKNVFKEPDLSFGY